MPWSLLPSSLLVQPSFAFIFGSIHACVFPSAFQPYLTIPSISAFTFTSVTVSTYSFGSLCGFWLYLLPHLSAFAFLPLLLLSPRFGPMSLTLHLFFISISPCCLSLLSLISSACVLSLFHFFHLFLFEFYLPVLKL